MTQDAEGPDSPLLTVGTSSAGEILADRYQLEEHINDDANGRQVWRGLDVVLRRPIAIIIRHPGGPTAGEMLSAAVAASRITHPHLVDVYDAVDEGDRAYVVREWVDGTSLRELVSDGPLDSVRATSIAHAVASAVAAAHSTGMVHGNVHPGTVLVADDGRVMLADARADDSATPERDVRSIGAILYCALTGHWPYAEAGPDRLPDAVRDGAGTLASPRQVRGGLPSYLSELATGLLDARLTPPTADQLALDLGRLDTDSNDEFFGDGPLGFSALESPRESSGRSHTGRKLVVGVVALLVIAAGGILLAVNLGGNPSAAQTPNSSGSAHATTGTLPASSGASPSTGPQVHYVPLSLNSIRLVENGGNDSSFNNAKVKNIVDGDENTYWTSNWYASSNFGNFKTGMGVLINLGAPMNIKSVEVDFLIPGATVQAMVGSTDPGPGNANTNRIASTYRKIGQKQQAESDMLFPIGQNAQYVLIWVTKLPLGGTIKPGKYLLGINEVKVSAE